MVLMRDIAGRIFRLICGNRKRVNRPAGVHESATVESSRLGDTIMVGAYSLIHNSSLSGRVNIGDHSAIVSANISGDVRIGRYTTFNGPGSDIAAKINSVVIGNFCSIARNCTIQEFNHIIDRCTSYYIFRNLLNAKEGQQYIWSGSEAEDIQSRGPISIGHDVWIGAQCVILSGVTIGNGAVIAANSTVTKDIPAYAIAGGTPAKVIRYRFSEEIIARLQKLAWWEWDDKTIRTNRDLFDGTLTLEKLDHALMPGRFKPQLEEERVVPK